MTLTAKQLSKLERQLDETYGSLLDEVRDELEASDNQQYIELINSGPADTGDAAIGSILADLNLAIIDRHIVAIRDIEAAKARIRDGTFGTCIECGKEIEFDRLHAYPTAKRDFVCQQRHEKIYAHEGTPTL